jgi:hypothetical protein
VLLKGLNIFITIGKYQFQVIEKTIWSTVKTVTARNCSDDNIRCLNVEGTIIHDNQAIPDAFSKYFSSTTGNIISDRNMIKSNTGKNNNNHINYLFQAYKHPFPKIKINYSTTKQTELIIKSLKTENSRS